MIKKDQTHLNNFIDDVNRFSNGKKITLNKKIKRFEKQIKSLSRYNGWNLLLPMRNSSKSPKRSSKQSPSPEKLPEIKNIKIPNLDTDKRINKFPSFEIKSANNTGRMKGK